MRMLCMLADGWAGSGFDSDGQFHDESRAHRLIFLHANASRDGLQ